MAYRLRFGSYDFPATLMPARIDSPGDISEQERPRADGSTQQSLRRRSRSLSVEGAITGTSADAIQSALDALKTNVLNAGQQELWFGRDDRYINAQCVSLTDDFNGGTFYGNLVQVSLGFKASDPYFYATLTSSASLSDGSNTVANSGEANALPSWTVTIGSAGTGPITLTNATTGESAVIGAGYSFSNGDVVVLSKSGYTVTLNGAAAFGLLSGQIPGLASGSNAVTLAAGGTATVGSGAVSWTDRWY